MIWMIGALVTAVSIGKAIFFDNSVNGLLGYFIAILLWGFFSFTACIPWMGLAAIVGLAFDTKAVESEKYDLSTLRIKDGVDGHFFLGSGTVVGQQYYFYYKKNTDGSLTPDKVQADDDVKIYEEDRKDAVLVKYEADFVNQWAFAVGMPTMQGKKSVEFRVPTGTVKIGYEM